jgi:hypothetical protein
MKRVLFAAFKSFSFLLVLAVAVSAQAVNFSDENVEYIFDLPNANWKMTVKPSPMSPNVEFVNGERSQGHFEIRKLSVKADAMISDAIADEEQKLKFLQGYVAGKEENFAGLLRGNIFNFEFVRSGRNMSGRFYFVRADPTTVYVLRFTGFTDSLRSARNQLDFIARSFQLGKK